MRLHLLIYAMLSSANEGVQGDLDSQLVDK
jgi:hypothetical protein